MTDAAPDAPVPSNGADAAAPSIRVLTQFLRDLSFENPRAPDSMHAGQNPPQIDMSVELNARGRQDGLFEVDLKLSVSATRDNATVFQAELLYGGLFQITGVAESDIEPVLLIECPRFLFPFARRIIADMTSEGGFPPLMLEPMDFGAIYASRKAAEGGMTVGNA